MSELTREKTKLEHSISELQSNIGVLEEQIQENKEREQLLVTYPDLNGPVNSDLTGKYQGAVIGDIPKLKWSSEGKTG